MIKISNQEAAARCSAIEDEQRRFLAPLAEILRQNITEIRRLDHISLVNSHCDTLIAEIMFTAESSARHLQNLAEDLVEGVRCHRMASMMCFTSNQTDEFEPTNEKLLEKNTNDPETVHFFENLEAKRRQISQKLAKFCANRLSLGFERAHLGLLRTPEDDSEIIRIDEAASLYIKNLLTGVKAKILQDETLFCCGAVGKLGHLDKQYKAGKEPKMIFENDFSYGNYFTTFIELSNGRLAIGTRAGLVIVFDLVDKSEKVLCMHENRVCTLHVCRDGRVASMSMDNTIKVFDPMDPTAPVSIMSGHGVIKHPCDMGILPNGYFVTCANNTDEGVLRVWDPSNGGRLVMQRPTGLIDACALRALKNGLVAVACMDGSIWIVSLVDDAYSRVLRPPAKNTHTTFICELPNGHLVVQTKPQKKIQLQVWNPMTCKLIQTVQTLYISLIESCELNPQQTRLVTCAGGEPTFIWPLCYENSF